MRLGCDELEALQQACGKTRVTPHRGPLGSVEAPALAQQRRVDGDLAEVVEAPGPAQPVDVGEGQTERAREAVDVAGDAERVAIRRRIALVDDVRERLQRAE